MALAELRGIAKSYGGVHALKGVDVTVDAGRALVLLGENGAGKSTLIKVLTGAVTPDRGTIRLDDREIVYRDPLHARALGVACVYQEPMIFRHLDVLENIFAGSEVTGPGGVVRRAAMAATVRPALRALELPDSILRETMGRLGPGHTQLVLIAQALVRDARIIIFDEPTSVLSRAETDRLVGIIRRLRDDGRAVVYITHRLEEVSRIGDHVTVLTDGRVTGDFPAAGVSSASLLQLMAGKTEALQAEEVARARAGAAAAAAASAPPRLVVRGLTREPAFRDVDWDAPAGTITGVYGLVGAGRSEVATAIFGVERAERGTIRLDGETVQPRSPAEAIRRGIGYLPEDRKRQGIFAPRSLEANLTANALPGLARRGALDFGRLRAEAKRQMAAYSIKAASDATPIGTLSGGNQQKGLFARWAAPSLRVLILDEPTRGIDIRTKEEIHDFIRAMAARGVAIVVISSDLAEVMALAQRMIVMRGGSVVEVMSGDAMTAERVLGAAIGAAASGRPGAGGEGGQAAGAAA